MYYRKHRTALNENGYALLSELYSEAELSQISNTIEKAVVVKDEFEKTKDVFAIRQLVNVVPELAGILFNEQLKLLLSELFEGTCFLTKAIYFDKPSTSNWFVPYHQDLSISVNNKEEGLKAYSNWTFKKGQYGVQPPIHILEDTVTVRIHLDKTDIGNGALRVVSKSHLSGVIREKVKTYANEFVCEVERGGIMLMKPLTLHASRRTTNGQKRRVVHLEFNKHSLDGALDWLEYYDMGSVDAN